MAGDRIGARALVAVLVAAMATMPFTGRVAADDPTPAASPPSRPIPGVPIIDPEHAPEFQATETAEASSTADTFQHGDLFVGLSDGRVQWRRADGTLNREIQVVPAGTTNQITGMAFDPAGNLLVTAFNADRVIRINNRGEVGGSSAPGALSRPESIVIDPVDGHIYVGQASFGRIARLDYALNKTAEYTVTAERRGADWIDFEDSGRCVLRYTSEDQHLLRYDVCTQSQLPNFSATFNEAYDHRTMPDGGALVADSIHVALLDATGQRIRTYDNPGVQKWFGVALDPDGTSFWGGDGLGDGVVKFDIDSGGFLQGFSATANTPPAARIGGLVVFDETAFSDPGPPAEQTAGTGSGLHGNNPTRLEADPVNTLTGNYVTQTVDLSYPGRGLSFEFSRTYNSMFAGIDGPLGPGWTHAYATHLTLNPDGSATLHAADGAQLTFEPNGAGGFTPPTGGLSQLEPTTGGFQLTRRDRVRYGFDSAGTLTEVVDRNGNALSFTYTAGQLTGIADTVGRSILLTYNAAGRLSSVAGPGGLEVNYAYHLDGRLASVTDVRGEVTTYTYDADGRLETTIDANGHTVVTNEYGADGRITAQTDARGKRGTFAWDAATETSTYTDTNGGVWTDDYDEAKLARQVDPLGNTTSYIYDAQYNVTSVVDGRGEAYAMLFDTSGSLLRRAPPALLGYSAEEWTYNANNDPVTYTDRGGNTTTYDYDATGNLIQTTEPLNTVTEYGRDAAGTGLLTSLVDPRGKVTTYGYDAEANLTSTTTPLGNRTTMTYDAAGWMLTRVEPRGYATGANPADYTTTFTYDAAGNLLTTTDPLGNVTSQTYDPVGNLLTVTDANQHTTTYAYDAANHLTSVTDARNGVTGYTYDDVGNLVTRTDANQHVTSYAYDLANRLTSTVDPLTNSWSTTYDAAGNVATRTDANGKTTTYAYDALNRLTSITYADTSTASVSLAYDANGNRISMADGAGTETSTYDALNRLTAVTRGTDTFSYGYDAAGNLTSRTYPSQTAQTFTYDDDGRLTSGNGASYAYDAAANLLTSATPDGLTARHSWDRAGRLLEVAHTAASSTLSRFTYGLDAVGNRVAMTTREGTVTYRYDELDRLAEACWSSTSCPGGAPATPLPCLECIGGLASRPSASTSPPAGETYRTYTYDPVGNRLSEASDAGTTSYAYDAADRLTSVTPPGEAAVPHTYDANGNQLTGGGATYTYDLADRLANATVGGTTETYTYAGDGTRLSASTGSQANKTTRFLWDRAFSLPQLALERNGNDALLRSYRYGLDLLSQAAGNSTYWYHHDGLGSVVDITDPSAKSLAWSEYYPYGLVHTAGADRKAPAVQTFAFTGEQLDSTTGLYHLRVRQYDPGTGRFLTTDPVVAPITDPHVAGYAYVRNRPLVAVDPSGEFLNLVAAAVGGVVGGIASTAAYGVAVLSTDADWDLGQAGVAAGTGFFAGAVCTATALIACGAANTAASAVQYGLAPGDKSVEGYLIAAGSGALLAPLVHVPYRPPIIKPHPSQIAQEYFHEAIYAFPGGFTRSFSAALIATGVQSAAAMTGSEPSGYGK